MVFPEDRPVAREAVEGISWESTQAETFSSLYLEWSMFSVVFLILSTAHGIMLPRSIRWPTVACVSTSTGWKWPLYPKPGPSNLHIRAISTSAHNTPDWDDGTVTSIGRAFQPPP